MVILATARSHERCDYVNVHDMDVSFFIAEDSGMFGSETTCVAKRRRICG